MLFGNLNSVVGLIDTDSTLFLNSGQDISLVRPIVGVGLKALMDILIPPSLAGTCRYDPSRPKTS
jgi:hypothetical protein